MTGSKRPQDRERDRLDTPVRMLVVIGGDPLERMAESYWRTLKEGGEWPPLFLGWKNEIDESTRACVLRSCETIRRSGISRSAPLRFQRAERAALAALGGAPKGGRPAPTGLRYWKVRRVNWEPVRRARDARPRLDMDGRCHAGECVNPEHKGLRGCPDNL